MSNAERKGHSVTDGKALYRKLIGPLSTDTAADEFATMDDTSANRVWLDRIAQRGGERGRAARARLAEWEASSDDQRDPLVDRQFTSGGTRGTDPFGGSPAA